MLKKIIVFFVLMTVLVACGSQSTSSNRPAPIPTKAWFEGGTLHRATVAQWLAADDANQLATAADWVTGLIGWDTLGEAREKSEDLKLCVSRSASSSPPELSAAELSVACMILMGWEFKD